ncbi:hypothetical protein ABHF33_13470 [Chitinibacter sp. FCG-7]|uniref:Uncharacterized protein n=1 Tax=Chitinibacter mangrovi TaxID=3153927 RepID=A0AAU7F9A6_9NEIS
MAVRFSAFEFDASAKAATEELQRQLNLVREVATLESSKAEIANTIIAILYGKIESLQNQIQLQKYELDAAPQKAKTALSSLLELIRKALALYYCKANQHKPSHQG